jgi:lipopolysaccharide assembly outer membrane protein LptD (OstA)
MQFAADSLTFNGAQSILSGAGGVRIVLPSNGRRAGGATAGKLGAAAASGKPGGTTESRKPGAGGNVTVTAGSFKYDIHSDLLTLRGAPAVALDDVRLTAGTLVYNGNSGRVDAKGGVTATFKEKGVTAVADTAVYTPEGLATFAGGVRIAQPDNGNTLTCDRLEYRDATGDVKASGAVVGGAGGAPNGGVKLTIPRENLTLVCGEINGNIEKESGTAKGDPVLTRGDSSVKGAEIRFHRETESIVVEVLGQDKTEYILAPDAFET